MFKILESDDTHEQAFRNKAWLDISREYAQDLGVTANFAALHGFYYSDSGEKNCLARFGDGSGGW